MCNIVSYDILSSFIRIRPSGTPILLIIDKLPGDDLRQHILTSVFPVDKNESMNLSTVDLQILDPLLLGRCTRPQRAAWLDAVLTRDAHVGAHGLRTASGNRVAPDGCHYRCALAPAYTSDARQLRCVVN